MRGSSSSNAAATVPRPYLNFGCGSTAHPEWTNMDLSAAREGVIVHDLRLGFPFGNESYDAVYGSHVLEHLQPEEAGFVLGECHRVLKPDGIVRIVVPDLEEIARQYLSALEKAATKAPGWDSRYDWLVLELYDQGVRNVSGGRMSDYLRRQLDDEQRRFIESRIGPEILRANQARSDVPGIKPPISRRILLRMAWAFNTVREKLAEACVVLMIGRKGALALRRGLFRASGEVHQWMYDRYSLGRVLEHAGFTDIRVCGVEASAIPGFSRFGLETIEGKPRKPDSLYMEARKPASATTKPAEV
jgi:predicted SAM-dependent methyltransferase